MRSMYLANDLVKAVIKNNDYSRIRLTAAGTKVFTKQEGGKGVEPQFRVLAEGLPVILPFMDPSTIITTDITTLKTLVQSYYPLISSFGDLFRVIVEARGSLSSVSANIKTDRKQAAGCHIVRFPPEELDGVVFVSFVSTGEIADSWLYRLPNEIVLPIWKSNVSLTLMMDKKAKRFPLNHPCRMNLISD